MPALCRGDVITYTEYDLTGTPTRKRVRQRLENMTVAEVIQPGEQLSRDRIEEYYGPELTDVQCLALAETPTTRLVLADDDDVKYCVELVRDFIKAGLQTVEIGTRAVPEPAEAPSYLQFVNMYGGGVN